jgi:Fur family transcriptional regulator, ferric uptake regulator
MSLEEVISRLRKSGHKVTPQRVVIIKTVLESREHLTPAELYEKIRRLDPEIGEVTIYRTLNILTEMGLLCMVHTGENTHSYVSRPPEHHGHLICSQCGKVINFTDCNLSGLEKRLTGETGFDIRDHRLDFFGNCRECSAKQRTKT